ncbi:hypothetical protein ACFL2H_03075 [Planctomycetota bacterium]
MLDNAAAPSVDSYPRFEVVRCRLNGKGRANRKIDVDPFTIYRRFERPSEIQNLKRRIDLFI